MGEDVDEGWGEEVKEWRQMDLKIERCGWNIGKVGRILLKK